MKLEVLQSFVTTGFFLQKLTLHACSVLFDVSLFTLARVSSLLVYTFLVGTACIHLVKASILICREIKIVFPQALGCRIIGTNEGSLTPTGLVGTPTIGSTVVPLFWENNVAALILFQNLTVVTDFSWKKKKLKDLWVGPKHSLREAVYSLLRSKISFDSDVFIRPGKKIQINYLIIYPKILSLPDDNINLLMRSFANAVPRSKLSISVVLRFYLIIWSS